MTPPLPEHVFSHICELSGSVWLDGGASPNGWSILTWSPTDVHTSLTDWQSFARSNIRPATSQGCPFQGGVLGYLGYGVGHTVESVPSDGDTPEPPLWLGRYDGGLCWHHPTRQWHVAGTDAFRRQANQILQAAHQPRFPSQPTGTATTLSSDAYEAAVRRILAFIGEGDCYQINLSRAVHVRGVGPSADAYRRLRNASSARFGAYLRIASDLAVLSNSPELMVRVQDGMALAEPIKGTRPRASDEQTDARLAIELESSPKERAELTMIVDLLRNDLGKVAQPGTVVAGHRHIQAHANVHHASQRIRAELRPGTDAWDVLAAVLPYGSVTGAPKVRACKRIDELETHPRGVYCGGIGFVSDGGDARWSVAIRTAVVHGNNARYHVGGGIVAESEPRAEWLETLAKGLALAKALHPEPALSREDFESDSFWSKRS